MTLNNEKYEKQARFRWNCDKKNPIFLYGKNNVFLFDIFVILYFWNKLNNFFITKNYKELYWGIVRDEIQNILVTRVPFHISIKHELHESPLPCNWTYNHGIDSIIRF